MTGETREARRSTLLPSLFGVGIGLLVALKVLLVSDISVEVLYQPMDDSLYVERAWHLLQGNAFGPYHSGTFLKYPGISLWLAAMGTVGIPVLISVNAVYIAAGLYVALGLMRAGTARWVALAAFALWLFNPVTLGYEWARVIREPLATGLFAVLTGAMLHILVALEQRRAPWLHFALFALVFAFSLFLREDDRLLWGLLVLFVVALLWKLRATKVRRTEWIAFVLAGAIAPVVLAKTYEFSLRHFVESRYGLPILHEVSEGEFPKLLAAIRSIETDREHRLVMVPQETLYKLHNAIPELRPVIDRLPPPGPGTYSCKMHGVCTEWSNGWMLFWIKEQMYSAGLTPTLPAAQEYFRRMRNQIERACDTGTLRCTSKGQGLIPPMELRRMPVLLAEFFRLVRISLSPDPHLVRAAYLEHATPAHVAEKFHSVAMTDGSGPNSILPSDQVKTNRPLSSLSAWRNSLACVYAVIAPFLLLASLSALVVHLVTTRGWAIDVLTVACLVVGVYVVARLTLLSYVATFMGPFVPRFVFSSYAVGLLLALPIIVTAYKRFART
jgi:hypothetical protein